MRQNSVYVIGLKILLFVNNSKKKIENELQAEKKTTTTNCRLIGQKK